MWGTRAVAHIPHGPLLIFGYCVRQATGLPCVTCRKPSIVATPSQAGIVVREQAPW